MKIFQEANRTLEPVGELHLPHGHTVAVDPTTHLVYFPLEDLNGKPVLRIMEFAGAGSARQAKAHFSRFSQLPQGCGKASKKVLYRT